MSVHLTALLLSAGIGERLKPFTEILPKCLMPIQGRPLLGIWLDFLATAGVNRFVINTHYKHNLVNEYLRGTRHWPQITIVYEDKLLGTAGTLAKNAELLSAQTTLMVHTDNLSVFSFSDFLNAHRRRPNCAELTLMTFVTKWPKSCGIVELDSKKCLTRLHEKVESPPGDLASAAVFLLEPSVVSKTAQLFAAKGHGDMDFSKEVLPQYVGKALAWHNANYHCDIGTPESYLQAHQEAPLKSLPQFMDTDRRAWGEFCVRRDFVAAYQNCIQHSSIKAMASSLRVYN